jgi:glycosyltransferase involved in cell wall biosynthesis
VVHDWLTGWRGGERVLEQILLLYPDADLFTLIHLQGSVPASLESRRIRVSPLSRLPGVGRYYRALLPLFPWAIRRFDLSSYDLVISCSHAVAKSVRTGPDTVHVSYCLTPMRYIWDQADAYLGRGLRRALVTPLVRALRRFDRATSGPDDVTAFIAISSTVRDRIARAYERDACVVYPPVDTDAVTHAAASCDVPGPFYLLVGGFVPYKREALAIDAFRGLDRSLVVAGDGPLRERLEVGAPDNVHFVGRVPDAELHALYRDCRALIYPQEEDFGIIAVEAQAAGSPVIAYRGGGALDTVRVPEGGEFFEAHTTASLRAAIDRFEAREADFDGAELRGCAQGFSIPQFRQQFARTLEKLLDAEAG